MKRLATLALTCSIATGASAVEIDDTFTCQSDVEGSPAVTMHARNGEVLAETPDDGRTLSYGVLTATPEAYDARREQAEPDGKKLTLEFHLDRTTGKTTLDMTIEGPGLAPATVHHTGTCRDFDPPEGS